ncbi:hypothetical protein J3E71DRAFT_347955 [Bipolaris maydis]|nr:hypothetical protein J3E71DRAFT_347955 [Bipolaris maydis]
MSNGEKALEQEMHPADLISNNAHDSPGFNTIPESTHRIPQISGCSQLGLEDSYEVSQKQNASSVSTSLATCYRSSMVLETLQKVNRGYRQGD